MSTKRRVALVTGAAQGIGRAVANRLASDGLDVALVDRELHLLEDAARDVEGFGRSALPLACDVTVSAEVEFAVDSCIGTLGSIDVLVCCAGVLRDAAILDISDDDWSLVVDVNLTGAFNCVRAVAKHMIGQHFGKIVLVSSTSAQGNIGQANYSAAKSGIEGLTRALSLELGPDNINVNAVAPGFTITEMTRALATKRNMSFDELITSAAADIPLRRVAQPSDLANVIAFFTSEDSSFVSGQILYATGGARGSTARRSQTD
ncbi:SDR family oxidoreductase [Rhodococcus sp. USK10]|uniref:3-oxoacyl-[acyl-carrier protein] reductase n=1 Tax=Rhodococcus wratislaviensis TaxID=44752 RepID=A0A402CEX8_RHOWR|nr:MULTISPECIES: SDR family NAD(P)-dependent oxidoreductase [Rhodococcus]QYB07081.1 SDR family oxidoreductase [Rhodococcus sp. USK10]GCE42162.1 3-oxoacyl-[acyl-carrier protein] reductase [Rhodococcus wratislaviensis]